MEKEEVAGHGRLAKGRQASGRRLRGRGAGSTAEVIQGEGEAGCALPHSPWLAPLQPPGHRPFVFPKTAAWNRTVTPQGSRGGPGHPTSAGARQASGTSQVERDDAEKSAREKKHPGSPNPLFLFL